jgi:MFS family permease
VPLYLQEAQRLTPMHTGLVLLPQALMMAVMMPTAGRIYDRFGPRWPAVIGLALAGGGTLMLTGINGDMTRPELIGWMTIRAAGLGLGMMPIMTGGLSALPADSVSSGSAFNTLVQRGSASLGLAVLTALATAQQQMFMADRSALISAADPRTSALAHDPGALLGLWQRMRIEVQAQAYSNVFLIAGITTLAAVGLAVVLRAGPASSAKSPATRHPPAGNESPDGASRSPSARAEMKGWSMRGGVAARVRVPGELACR